MCIYLFLLLFSKLNYLFLYLIFSKLFPLRNFLMVFNSLFKDFIIFKLSICFFYYFKLTHYQFRNLRVFSLTRALTKCSFCPSVCLQAPQTSMCLWQLALPPQLNLMLAERSLSTSAGMVLTVRTAMRLQFPTCYPLLTGLCSLSLKGIYPLSQLGSGRYLLAPSPWGFLNA